LVLFTNLLGVVTDMAVLRDFIPPVVSRFLLKLGFAGNRFRYGYKGWEEAQAKCFGYNSEVITQALVSASRRVRDGEIAYERDGVEFDSIQYSWPLLAAILGSPRSTSKLRVLDWGGSLGSTYRQNKNLIEAAGVEVEWVVIEQEHLVEIGTREFSNTQLSFRSTIESVPVGYFDLVIFASSICYLENPSKILEQVKSLMPRAIAFDRTPNVRKGPELIGIQTVGRRIYRASYPIRIFSIGWIEDTLSPEYRKVSEWVCGLQPDPQSISKGLFFLRSL
jgi:putative methyltransferase (TIGR04325 family)